MTKEEMIELLDHVTEMLDEMLESRNVNWDDMKNIRDATNCISFELNRK